MADTFSVVPYRLAHDTVARDGRPSSVPAGTEVYAIQSAKDKFFFAWSYTQRESAERLILKLTSDPTMTTVRWEFNRRREPEQCSVTAILPEHIRV